MGTEPVTIRRQVNQLWESIEASRSEDERSRLFKERKQLQQRVMAGESLGSPIEDYVFVTFGSIDPELVNYLDLIHACLKECVGQSVLVVRRDRIPLGGCGYHTRETRLHETFYFGIIEDAAGLRINLSEKDIRFPVSRVVVAFNHPDARPTLRESAVELYPMDCVSVRTDQTVQDDDHQNNLPCFATFIGDEEVLKWMGAHGNNPLLEQRHTRQFFILFKAMSLLGYGTFAYPPNSMSMLYRKATALRIELEELLANRRHVEHTLDAMQERPGLDRVERLCLSIPHRKLMEQINARIEEIQAQLDDLTTSASKN